MRPIAISLSPNTQEDDARLALSLLFAPEKWLDKKYVLALEQEFQELFGNRFPAFAANSGRSAEYVILKALGIGRGDNVAIQAFTCVAVPNSVLWTGAKPLYIDIDKSYNLDPTDLRQKINKNTKAIIVQHTFGIPAQIDKIKKIAKENNLFLIEDCAHALGATYKKRLVGTFGNASFFSFGRDKILSSVFGGMILCIDKSISLEVKKLVSCLPDSSAFWVVQQLLHPVMMNKFILPLYSIQIGKVLLAILQSLGILSKAVFEEEKLCHRPSVFPSRMAGGLALLALHQLKKLKNFNKRRREIAKRYFQRLKNTDFCLPPNIQGSCWLRFPVLHQRAADIYLLAKKKGIILGNWYPEVVWPVANLKLVGYKKGSCPNAEKAAKNIVNLPTYPLLSDRQVDDVVSIIQKWNTG